MAESAAEAVLASWRLEPGVTAGMLVAAWLYTRGWKRLVPLRANLLPRWRLIAFLGGLGTTWLALASPVDAFGGLLLSAHMVQHLLLIAVAPPLILLGAPVVPLLRGLPAPIARDALGPFLNWPLLRRFLSILTHPASGLATMIVSTWVWHAPALYELALRSGFWHRVEHACFLASSLLFWWSVLRPWPAKARGPQWAGPLLLLAADISNSALAAILTFSDRVLYPTYAAVPRIGPSALDDQVLAGVLMWVPGSLIFLVPAVVITIRLLSPSSLVNPGPLASVAAVRGNAATRVLQGRPRRAFDLLDTPAVGAFLRAAWGRRALQAVLMVIALAIVVDGLAGHQMGSMNLAGVLPWTYWRGFAVIGLLAAGNVFCFGCPFMLPREIGRRLGLATRRWPRAWRSKWASVALIIGFFWAYEAFSLWDRPFWTASIVIGYFAAAFVVDTFFRGASFCKYLCPIGQFHFVNSLVSPLEVKARRPAVCASCVTRDCIRGNDHSRGCELHLYMPRKSGNLDCTFCLDCVRACPHDNIGLLAVMPARDVLRDEPRSSVGRYSQRPDLAALSLVLVFAAFANAAAMVEPASAVRDIIARTFGFASTSPVTAAAFLLMLIVIPGLLLGTAVVAGRVLSHSTAPVRELICRFSLALLPLGLAMWVAHFSFHLLQGWASAWPVVKRSSADIGIDLLGPPRWSVAPLVNADAILTAQILVLDFGLLLALYLGWRLAQSYTDRARAAVRLFTPWAMLAAGLFVAGISIVVQPMQMRGMVH